MLKLAQMEPQPLPHTCGDPKRLPAKAKARRVPRTKVHAVCKMHQIKCVGIRGRKKVSQLILKHGPARPRFRIICVHFFIDLSNVILFSFFVETRLAAQQNTFYESEIEGPPQAQLFSV